MYKVGVVEENFLFGFDASPERTGRAAALAALPRRDVRRELQGQGVGYDDTILGRYAITGYSGCVFGVLFSLQCFLGSLVYVAEV